MVYKAKPMGTMVGFRFLSVVSSAQVLRKTVDKFLFFNTDKKKKKKKKN